MTLQVVGTVAFVVLQGKKFGPQAHSRYFQLKSMSGPQKERHVEERKAAYTRSGNTLDISLTPTDTCSASESLLFSLRW